MLGSGIRTDFLLADDLPTTVKTRIVAQGQQIVRIDREANDIVDESTTHRILRLFSDAEPPDVVILSDYAKGVLSLPLCRGVIDTCQGNGTPVIVDPKGRDYRRYHGATAITPNQNELLQALGELDFADDFVPRAQRFFLDELAIISTIIALPLARPFSTWQSVHS